MRRADRVVSKRVRETPEVVEGVGRMIRGVGKRAAADVDALPLLAGLGDLVEQQLCEAAQACVAFGWSWADVGRAMGMSRQAAHQRFSGTARRPGTNGLSSVKGQLTLEATG